MYFADECISQGMSTLNINRMTVWEELDLSLYPRSTFNIEWNRYKETRQFGQYLISLTICYKINIIRSCFYLHQLEKQSPKRDINLVTASVIFTNIM